MGIAQVTVNGRSTWYLMDGDRIMGRYASEGAVMQAREGYEQHGSAYADMDATSL